jgi:predicted dehydrogenase
LNAGNLRIVTAAGERRETHPPAANLHAPLIEDFVQAIATGQPPAISGEDGLLVQEIEEALYRMAAPSLA